MYYQGSLIRVYAARLMLILLIACTMLQAQNQRVERKEILREGRVDRYGQPKDKVRTLLLYGEDNPMDGTVLKVLLRKPNPGEAFVRWQLHQVTGRNRGYLSVVGASFKDSGVFRNKFFYLSYISSVWGQQLSYERE